jgi:hypothetical protein
MESSYFPGWAGITRYGTGETTKHDRRRASEDN